MIRQCTDIDFETIRSIINDAAKRYEGVIPDDCWKVPYMSGDELRHEIEDGVVFWGYEKEGHLIGVMGIQNVKDVTLIRHAYVRPTEQGQGIGTELLSFLSNRTPRPILIGTWADAVWAVGFYEKRGFVLVPLQRKDQLLKKYWSVPQRQSEASVVLADKNWKRLLENDSNASFGPSQGSDREGS